jgi:WD40 repeat protein/predicted Ser/Thr protein kinase
MAKTPPPGPDTRVGLKAVEAGLLSEAQLAQVRRQLATQAAPPPLSAALVAKGLLTAAQVEGFRSGGLAKRIGKYRLIRELGRGGMGVVYEAEDVGLKRRCALKTMIEAEGVDPKERRFEEERFVREARLCANLPRHPGIVGVYDAGIIEGRRVIAMELIEGKQFHEWRKNAPFRQQIQVLKAVADAVAHAHAHKVVHRDLKPSNILVDARRQPRVTDFGLAKRSQETTTLSLTSSGMIVGTPAYMSPEQAEARDEVGPATDQWALGVMLYEILTKRLPFQGASAVEVLMKTVQDPVVPPTRVLRAKGSVDERLERLCMRALRKNPSERFPDVKFFADGLGAWLRDTAPHAPKRRSWLPPAVGAAVLLAVVALVVLVRPPRAEEVDVPALVEEGKALMERKMYGDALIAFGRALKEEPRNEAARKGKAETERRMNADAELAVAVRRMIADGDVTGALGKIDGVPEPSRSELKTSLKERMIVVYGRLMERAVAAKSRGDMGQVDALVSEVASWKEPDYLRKLTAELASTDAPAPPKSAPSFPRLHEFRCGNNGVTMVAFSPDGRLFVTGNHDGFMNVWDLVSKTPRLEVRHPTRTNAAELSRDGRWLAVGLSGGDVLVYDTKTLSPRAFKGHTIQVMGVAFSPDAQRLYSASTDADLRIWSVADGGSLASYGGHDGGAMSLARSPDGRTVAVGSAGGEIKLWDVAEGRVSGLLSPPSGGGMLGLAFSPDGARLAGAGSKGTLWVWDVKTSSRRELVQHVKEVHGLAWSPDGRWIATAAQDEPLKVYDAATGAVKAAFPSAEGWFSVTFSADGRRLAGGSYDWQGRIYDISALK